MIWNLLKKNISFWQMAGYALSAIVGLAILLCAVQFYTDVKQALQPSSSTGQYLVVSKSASMLGTLGIGRDGDSRFISADDIAKLRSLPWVDDLAPFEAANFGVSASVNVQGHGLWTQMFLEAVPDAFLDEVPEDWNFNPDDPDAVVPVIIPRDYLALYNHGYAPAHGLPQMSEGLIGRIVFDLYFTGNGHAETRKGRIVGFTDRINTIAAPQEFIDWANSRYSPQVAVQPTRLIIKVSDPGNPSIGRALSKLGLQPSANDTAQGKAMYALRIAATAVGAVGLAICALALFILSLSVSLLLNKNKEKGRRLLLIGYSPAQASAPYLWLVGTANAAVLLVAIAILLISSSIWAEPLHAMGYKASSPAIAIVVGAGVMAVITALNAWSIRRFFNNCYFDS